MLIQVHILNNAGLNSQDCIADSDRKCWDKKCIFIMIESSISYYQKP